MKPKIVELCLIQKFRNSVEAIDIFAFFMGPELSCTRWMKFYQIYMLKLLQGERAGRGACNDEMIFK